MTRLSETIEVKASPRQVMVFLRNADNLTKYLPVSKVEVLESDAKRVKVRHDLSVAGKTMELVCLHEVDDSERRLTCRAVEGNFFESTWSLQEIRDGTQITYILEYEPPGGLLGKLLEPFGMRKGMQTVCLEALRKIKAQLET